VNQQVFPSSMLDDEDPDEGHSVAVAIAVKKIRAALAVWVDPGSGVRPVMHAPQPAPRVNPAARFVHRHYADWIADHRFLPPNRADHRDRSRTPYSRTFVAPHQLPLLHSAHNDSIAPPDSPLRGFECLAYSGE
jgi:hypothetical protein